MSEISSQWLSNYRLLENYYMEHGNIDVPCCYEINGIRLGKWLSRQRDKYKNLLVFGVIDERVKLLNQLDMKWNVRKENWDHCYHLLQDYYKEHGHIDVPQSYVVNGVNLGTWLNTQRQAYKGKSSSNLTEKQIQLLDNLGMKWNLREEKWDDNYYLLEAFYKKYGHINVPQSYVVNGIKLGTWLNKQRRAYRSNYTSKLTEDQIILLNDLNIDWNIKDTKVLNGNINDKNVDKYNNVLKKRLETILDDLIYEGINEFNDDEFQKEIEKKIVKKMWR